jgi:4-diphosphocytidyl-2-C-methyl-D-erythritol kinase
VRALRAPAKINLTLKVLGRRADGYHEISSVFQAISLCDEVRVRWLPTAKTAATSTSASVGAASCRPPADGFFVGIRCDDPSVPVDGTNLASRAAYLLYESVTSHLAGTVEIDLVKRIPAAAGLAGGSTDAAATLLALADLWGVRASVPELASLAAGLGADVPFCVYACAAANSVMLAEGIGERLTPLAAGADGVPAPGSPVLLVKPDIAVPTAEIYAAYDERAGADAGGDAFDNDLQPVTAARYPVVADVLATMRDICADTGGRMPPLQGVAGATKIQMSGSGPTVFALFENGDGDAAQSACEKARAAFPAMRVLLTETL